MGKAQATLLLTSTDLIAITVLAYGIYFQRHRRRDMLIAYLALNVGVMAVTIVLASAMATMSPPWARTQASAS